MDDGVYPSGLPQEVDEWLKAYLAAGLFGARVERMRRLMQKENELAKTSANSAADYTISAHWGIGRKEGKAIYLQCQSVHSYSRNAVISLHTCWIVTTSL